MSFEPPAPDLTKLLHAWEEWERGEETPGKVLANMKTAGLPDRAAAADRQWLDPRRLSRRAAPGGQQHIPRPATWTPGAPRAVGRAVAAR